MFSLRERRSCVATRRVLIGYQISYLRRTALRHTTHVSPQGGVDMLLIAAGVILDVQNKHRSCVKSVTQ